MSALGIHILLGIHKHFRMLAISEHLKSQGYATDDHTRIPGIWKKLGTLYNLPALDERVGNTFQASIGPAADTCCHDSRKTLSQQMTPKMLM